MRSVSSFIFFILISISITRAQVEVHIGVATGYNATFVLDKGLSKDPRYNSIMTYNWAPIGMSFGVDFSRTFGLTLEGIKSTQGKYTSLSM